MKRILTINNRTLVYDHGKLSKNTIIHWIRELNSKRVSAKECLEILFAYEDDKYTTQDYLLKEKKDKEAKESNSQGLRIAIIQEIKNQQQEVPLNLSKKHFKILIGTAVLEKFGFGFSIERAKIIQKELDKIIKEKSTDLFIKTDRRIILASKLGVMK